MISAPFFKFKALLTGAGGAAAIGRSGSTVDADLTALAATKAPLASAALTGTPTAPTAAPGTNTTQLATTAFIQAAIAALVASSPAALDTLNELAVALGNDANFSTTMVNALALKAKIVGHHELLLTTGNGHGSTNTKARRYSTPQINTGTALSYADSATLGAAITVNVTGIYAIGMADIVLSGTGSYYGASVNSSQLSTSITAITAANRLFSTGSQNAFPTVSSRLVYLTAGDVVVPHTHGNLDSTFPESSFFSMILVSAA